MHQGEPTSVYTPNSYRQRRITKEPGICGQESGSKIEGHSDKRTTKEAKAHTNQHAPMDGVK